MKALITGGTGFLGSHIARVLVAAGHEVRIMHRPTSRLTALEGVPYQYVAGDIGGDPALLRAACEGCDWVFHAAAVAHYWRADVQQMYEVNVEGTRRLLQAARDAGVRRFIFTSSAAAIGPRADGTPASEDDAFAMPPDLFPYGHSKWLAEGVVQQFVRKGMDAVILNPSVIFGPGDLNQISGTFIIQVKRFGAFAATTSGGVMVIDVRDVAAAHLAAAERGRTGERYIVGAYNMLYKALFNQIAEIVRAPRPMLYAPDFVLEPAARLIDFARRLKIDTPIDANQTRIGGKKIFFDTSKAQRELATPQIPLRQSIEDTYNWYVAQGMLKPA